MAHGLRRVSYATCDPGSKQFCFLARQPGGHINKQYCHLFVTKTAEQVRFSIYRLTLFFLYLIRSYTAGERARGAIIKHDTVRYLTNVPQFPTPPVVGNDLTNTFITYLVLPLHINADKDSNGRKNVCKKMGEKRRKPKREG